MSTQEQDILTDHAYDGIQEYDNPMPGWWVWSFIISILFAFPYWAWFHFNDDHGIYVDLAIAMEAAADAAPDIDESPEALFAYLSDPQILAKGAKVFKGRCAACHVIDGGGFTGPNLCDDNFKVVKTLSDILVQVREGSANKAMPPHKDSLRQPDIVRVSVFAASLRGTIPASPKAAEGETIAPWK